MKVLWLLVFGLIPLGLRAQMQVDSALILMGSRFDITVIADDKSQGEAYIKMAVEEISRIEKLISSWDQASQTSEINRKAGIEPVKVDAELFGLIERSIRIAQLTSGAFDISYASMDRIWKFDGSMMEMPDSDSILKSVAKVGYQNIALDRSSTTVFLKKKGMKIGFGGIGKGYAADKAKALLMAEGVKGGIINASGDLNTWGTRPNGESWMVGITNPLNKNKVFSWMPVDNQAVVTSGNYEKFVILNGERYTHIIDPRTGMPSRGIVSATVFARKAELADALATSFFVMGVDTALDMTRQLKGVECILIDDEGKIHASDHVNLKTMEP